MARKKEKYTLKNLVVYDSVAKRFIQKSHIVHGKKVLSYPIAQCKNCLKDYPKKRVDQSFCNDNCRKDWHKKKYYGNREPNLSPRKCSICSAAFTPTRPWSRYCSEECRAISRQRKLAESRQVVSAPA